MIVRRFGVLMAVSVASGAAACGGAEEPEGSVDEAIGGALQSPQPNPSGRSATFTTAGSIDHANPFFVPLGFNKRTCETCHKESDGWTLSAVHAQQIFDATNGNDPLFTTNDGSLCAGGDVSTPAARRQLFSLLLDRGLIRIPINLAPATSEFELVAADTYPCAYAKRGQITMFRRPLPATNLKFNASIMWDGREPSLAHQATDATLGHAQGTVPLPAGSMAAVVALESGFFTAQTFATAAGDLSAGGALGGPQSLAAVPFSIAINPGGGDPRVFSIFDAWTGSSSAPQAQIARGQAIFNERTFQITGVAGTPSPSFGGRCSSCHNTFNSGGDSVPEFLGIGTADGARRPPDLPLYTLRNRMTKATVQTTDPGRAMITGKWADIGTFKTPGLRGLAARAPYFHNGLAPNLDAVVDFYDQRFAIGFTAQEHADLVAFLSAL